MVKKGDCCRYNLKEASVYMMRSLLSLNESTPTQRQYLYPLKNSHNPLQVCTFSTSTEQTKETAGIYPTHNTHIDPTPAQNH